MWLSNHEMRVNICMVLGVVLACVAANELEFTCTAGFYLVSNPTDGTSCKPCPVGEFQDIGPHSLSTCQSCPADMTTTGTGSEKCVECAWPHYISDGMTCTCGAGYYYDESLLEAEGQGQVCIKCPSGWTSDTGAVSEAGCDTSNVIELTDEEVAGIWSFLSSSRHTYRVGEFMLTFALLHGILECI